MAWKKRGAEKTIEEVFLRNIGAKSLNDINMWFKKSYNHEYCVDMMKEAASFAKTFKDKRVTIVGDYDGDGVTSTAILYLGLKRAGFIDVRYRIPKRFSEGYGISSNIIDEIECGLVITCDNGISQIEAISKAKDKGLSVIIIDHHLPLVIDGNTTLPPADFIIDPNAIPDSADFNGYCGAGLSYKFIQEMLDYDNFHYLLLGFACIGTITDVMELREENYVFVRNGLNKLTDARFCTSGLYALISACNLTKYIQASDIGFKIGPTLNAASRMSDEGAMEAVKLLTYNGPYPEAVRMAERLLSVNEDRKSAKKEALKRAHEVIDEECLYGEIPLVVYVPGISEGIIGIIAGNLCEEYNVPTIVLSDSEDGCLKGSARSCGNYNIKDELDKCSSLLLKYGGHSGAAGLSLFPEKLAEFKNALQINSTGFSTEAGRDLYYDIEISANELPKVVESLHKFAPFGEGNEDIVFKVNNFSVVPRYGAYKKLLGADESIIKMYSADAVAIGFDMASRFDKIEQPKNLNLIGTLSVNYFNGSCDNQIEFVDFENVEKSYIETPLAKKLALMART